MTTTPQGVATEPPRPPGPVRVLGDGLTVAAGSSKLLRGASIYVGLLTLAMAGPGVVAELWVLSWAGSIDAGSLVENQAAVAATGRSGILLLFAVVGILVVSVEGGAIGMMLMAGRVTGRPITLRTALERSRRVFWRLVRVALVVGLLEFVATLVWRWVIGSPVIDPLGSVGVEPIPGAIVSLPFVYAGVAIVVADDAARPALRHSIRVTRRSWRLALALAAFALVSGVVEGLALGSGFDVIVRVTDVLQLDVTSGGLNLLLASVLALAIVTAVGSLVFTVAAVVSAPQVVAWMRLREPLTGLPPDPSEPTLGATDAPVGPPTPDATDAPVGPTTPDATDAPVGPTTPDATDAPVGPPTPDATDLPTSPDLAAAPGETVNPDDPSEAGIMDTPAVPQSAWSRPPPFRWMTIQMRLAVIVLWTGALLLLLGGPPA